jgi:hypothetical protein
MLQYLDEFQESTGQFSGDGFPLSVVIRELFETLAIDTLSPWLQETFYELTPDKSSVRFWGHFQEYAMMFNFSINDHFLIRELTYQIDRNKEKPEYATAKAKCATEIIATKESYGKRYRYWVENCVEKEKQTIFLQELIE